MANFRSRIRVLMWGAFALSWSPSLAQAKPPATKKPPPVVSLARLEVRTQGGLRQIDVAHPKGWTGDYEPDGRSVRLFGPEGEGEMLIAVATHGSELGQYLGHLKSRHPGSVPSPPQTIDVPGVKPENGERATRFVITGREAGELVMIERGGLIVLIGTIVTHDAWSSLAATMAACYPSVQISAPTSPTLGDR